ncbi:SCH9_2 [Sanghuangporus vaninii]
MDSNATYTLPANTTISSPSPPLSHSLSPLHTHTTATSASAPEETNQRSSDQGLSHHSNNSIYSVVLKSVQMLKFWPSTPIDQLTPRAAPDGRERNPFEDLHPSSTSTSSSNLSSHTPSAAPAGPNTTTTTSTGVTSGSDNTHSTSTNNPPRSPTAFSFQTHHLLNTHARSRTDSSSGGGDMTPLAPGLAPPIVSSGVPDFVSAIPTKQFALNLNLHVPDKMHNNANSRAQSDAHHADASAAPSPPTTQRRDQQQQQLTIATPIPVAQSPSTASSTSSSSASSSVSRGQLHVKLIQARGLNVHSVNARPYVVVQFEQNEFVSRDPIHELEKEVKGTATNLSRNSSSSALSALGAINSRAIEQARRSAANSTASSPQSSVSSNKSTRSVPYLNGDGRGPGVSGTAPSVSIAVNGNGAGVSGGLFGRLSAHNPVWKHEVSFDVTSDQSVITLNVYDRADEEQIFLGMVEIKPVLKHDHTVDHWFKLLPHENEVVTGEIRVQTTYEHFKTKRALTPRDFEFLKLIGRGTFGRVFQVRKKDTRRIYAMKVLSKKEIIAKKEIAHTIGERKILQQSLNSPFLVGLKFSFQTDTDLYLVTDFKSGGELFWHLQKETKFGEDRARFYVAELVLALEHLHKYDIVYRDLKPENILLDATGHIALCDFGLSKPDLKADQLTNTFCGTTEYLAPEVLLDDHGYSKLVDFWSLGVLLFEMCCGWSPFYAEDTQQMYQNICFGKIRFPKNVISDDGKLFVKGLLNRNPKHRLGAQHDADELKEHAFFKTIDWKALAAKQVTPPFIPVVESDESVDNFDPEFTSADLTDAGIELYDEDDPSEDWVAQSITGSYMQHTPNGPLGSDLRDHQKEAQQGMVINGRRSKRADPEGSPISNSVQEKFRGFSFSGESFIVGPAGRLAEMEPEDENALDEADTPPDDDDFDDDRPGGRTARRSFADI